MPNGAIRKIFKTGHSLAVTLSSQVLKGSGLKLGDEVRIDFDEGKGKITIGPASRQRQLSLNLRARHRLGETAGK
jgi:antitoxin component of MazEF toxin-antitoxin module